MLNLSKHLSFALWFLSLVQYEISILGYKLTRFLFICLILFTKKHIENVKCVKTSAFRTFKATFVDFFQNNLKFLFNNLEHRCL